MLLSNHLELITAYLSLREIIHMKNIKLLIYVFFVFFLFFFVIVENYRAIHFGIQWNDGVSTEYIFPSFQRTKMSFAHYIMSYPK